MRAWHHILKKRTLLIATCLAMVVILLLVMPLLIMTEGQMPTDDTLIALSDQLIADSKILLKKYPAEAYTINEDEWPESIKSVSPLSLSANREGLHIRTKERFVESWGIFIPREDSDKYSEQASMPLYDRIVDGVYKFYAD